MAEETKRETFRIYIESHPEFPAQYGGFFLTSSSLCKTFSDVFREVYSDWEGCKLEFDRGIPVITSFFNQRQEDINGLVPATSIFNGKKVSGNNVIDRRRNMDEQQRNGDRFFLTQEGKDGLSKFIVNHRISRKSGEPDWGSIVLQASPGQPVQGSPMGFFNRVQYTMVRYMDPNKILSEIYGSTNEKGEPVEYAITVVNNRSSIPGYANRGIDAGWLLRVDQLNSKQLAEVAQRDLGYMMVDDLGIIR